MLFAISMLFFFKTPRWMCFQKLSFVNTSKEKENAKGGGHQLSNDFNKTQAIISKKDYGLELSAKAVQHM